MEAEKRNSLFSTRIEAVRQAETALREESRNLTPEEITLLEARGNYSPDWSQVLVHRDFIPDFIRNSSFSGEVLLGIFSGKERTCGKGITISSGIVNTTIRDSVIHSEVSAHGAGLIDKCHIMDGATVFETKLLCGSTGGAPFGIGTAINVGNEAGGREFLLSPELSMEEIISVCTNPHDETIIADHKKSLETLLERTTFPCAIVDTGACITTSGTIRNCFIGEDASVNGALLLEDSVMVSSTEAPVTVGHGAHIRKSMIQWGSSVTSMAIVEKSFLGEASGVERHGKVTSSVLGPNTEVGEGEVTSSLVGPFVGFHHQSLLIAAVWPEGKGNIGYGANVGSNHTSKCPDQEIHCGEGLFFGLGSNIKFPSNFVDAPYSIVATAVTTLPQKVDFPFSLINSPTSRIHSISPSYNEIFPAWVLYGNPYLLMRSEKKFATRNKAPFAEVSHEIFTPTILEKMVIARNRLRDIENPGDSYTESAIPGLGKNFLTERNRRSAVEGYTFHLQYRALLKLFYMTKELSAKERSDEKLYSNILGYEEKLLKGEGLDENSLGDNLSMLSEMIDRLAQNTKRAKERDDGRGRRIIPHYDAVTVLAEDDPHVKATLAWAEDMKEDIKAVKELLTSQSL